MIVGAYLARLRRVVADKRALRQDARHPRQRKGSEADAIRDRIGALARKYNRFAVLFDELLPALEGPLDLEALVEALPASVLSTLASVARRAMGLFARDSARAAGEPGVAERPPSRRRGEGKRGIAPFGSRYSLDKLRS